MIKPIHPLVRSIVFLLVVFISQLTSAEGKNRSEKASPETIDGTIRVNSEQVIELIESFEDLVIIDARIQSDRKQGYLEGSISLPDYQTTCESLAKHIPTTQSPVVFYCNGVMCGRSGKSVKVALECNYEQVYWFKNGIAGWKEKALPLYYDGDE